MANQGRGRYPVVDALNRDWSVLADRHRGLVSRWALRNEAFIDCVSLDDVLSAVQLRPDAALRALLTEVSNGDELAARVVLQAMIGRMVRMAIRDPKASIDDYLAALWCQIRSYPLASRPDRIAANLSMDTFKSLRREQRWMRNFEVQQCPPETFLDERYGWTRLTWNLDGTEPDHEVCARDVLLAGCRRRLIDPATRRLLEAVYLDGLDPQVLSRHHRSTPGALRVRCSRAVRTLADHARELVEAA